MMIQDIEGFDATYKEIKPKKEDYLLVYKGNYILLKDNLVPRIADYECNRIYYGFSIGEDRFFICLDEIDGKYEHIEIFRNYPDRKMAFSMVTGLHLYHWYKKHIYCPVCGKKLIHTLGERRLECTCGNLEFPTISPAITVGIKHKDKILLTKYSKGYAPYALVAGYSEVGESLEDTIKREVYEETNLRVKDIQYVTSQPWGLSSSLLMGFYATLDGEDNIVFNDGELKEAKWANKEEIDLEDDMTSLTRFLILKFKNS